MNILLLFSQPWRVGGAETHTEALIKGLAGDRIWLAVNEGSDEDRLLALQQKFPLLTILKIQARGINFFRWKTDLKRLERLLQRHQIEAIFAQQRTAGIWAWLLKRRTAVPFTVTMHDSWHRAKGKEFYPRIFPKMLAVSENLAMILRRDFGFLEEQIRVIDNGIDFSAFQPAPKAAARNALAINLPGQLLLHVSRFSRVKGAVALRLIEAMELVVEHMPQMHLVVIGEGPLQGEIIKKAEAFNARCGRDVIEVRGFTDAIVTWYQASDLLIGEGRVAIETLACERPVVAIRNEETFVGAIRRENIAYACDVNFDGRDYPATRENLAAEILHAAAITPAECQEIAHYIRNRLSLELMAKDYRQAVAEQKK